MTTNRNLRQLRQTLAWGGALVAALSALAIYAYNPLQDDVSNSPVATRWQGASVTWSLNPSTGSNVTTTGGVDVRTAVSSAFNIWPQTQFNNQSLNSLVVLAGPDSTLTDPNERDCLNVVSFTPSSSVSFPTGTIAFTDVTSVAGTPPFTFTCTNPDGTVTTKTCNLQSCLRDADMVFNPTEQFSTTTPPLASHFDVQAVASHEFGHFIGLDHSGIAHTVMFPFGDTRSSNQQRNLSVDDIMGVAFLYPSSAFSTATGILSGQITLGGSGIFASHVVAIDAKTGAAVLDGLTSTDGTYKLVGLPPGSYNVVALPLAPDHKSGIYSLDDFGGWSCGYGENSPPCCDPATDKTCTGTRLSNPTNYTGKFF